MLARYRETVPDFSQCRSIDLRYYRATLSPTRSSRRYYHTSGHLYHSDISLRVRDQYKCLHKGPTKGYEQFIRQMRARRVSGVKQTVVAGEDLGFFAESGGDGRTSSRSCNRIKRNARLRSRISICLVLHNRFPPQ